MTRGGSTSGRRLKTLALGGGLLASCAKGPAAPDPAAYRAGVEAWHADRVTRLTAEDGWLSVVGLYWLSEAEGSESGVDQPREIPFGSAADNAMVFPPNAPPHMGRFVVEPAPAPAPTAPALRVRLLADPAVTLTHEGQPVGELELAPDATGTPTMVEWESMRFYVIARDGRLALRLKDSAAAARTAFHAIERYPVDPAWRLEGRFEAYDPPRRIPIPTILGYVEQSLSPGAVLFELAGVEQRLDVIDEEPEKEGNPLFVIFGDPTNRDTTYGAGRFLYVDPPDAAARVVIDFNRAYNPPCAFTAFATCPLPPSQNRLAARIEAGEKRHGDH